MWVVFLEARKRAMSAMMPSDEELMLSVLIIELLNIHKNVSAIKEAFSYIQLIFTGEGYQNYFSRGSRVCTTDHYI